MTAVRPEGTGMAMEDLAREAREMYERDGFAIVRDVLDPGLVSELRAYYGWVRDRASEEARGDIEFGHRMLADEPFFLRVVSDERLLAVAERFVGPDMALFSAGFIAKEPGSRGVLWHQDGVVWRHALDKLDVAALWIAVDDSDLENGCLRVLPGSHLAPIHEHDRSRRDAESESLVDPALVDESQVAEIVLKAGDLSIHHPNIIHGSKPNRSQRRRCGLAVRYIPTDVHLTREAWPLAYLLAGSPGVNEYKPWPAFDPSTHFPFAGSDDWNESLARRDPMPSASDVQTGR